MSVFLLQEGERAKRRVWGLGVRGREIGRAKIVTIKICNVIAI
jgi:hypothetical protein